MKWFLELGPCWGGAATVTPAGETASVTTTRRKEAVSRGPRRVERSKYKTRMHWKPKLHVISEESWNNVDLVAKRSLQLENKKPSAKAKPPTTKADDLPKPSHQVQDYWKISQPMPVAAFTPTPFIF